MKESRGASLLALHKVKRSWLKLPGNRTLRRSPLRKSFHALSCRSILAGLPATIARGGTSFVTTEPAPITEFSPIVIPHKSVAPDPIDAPRLTTVFRHFQSASVWSPPPGLVARGRRSFVNMTPCPTKTSSSISTPSQIKV